MNARGTGGPRSSGGCETLWRLVLAAVLLLAAALPAVAHDIPGEVRVHAFAKPEGNRLHVVLRMPLSLLLNVDLPKQGPGYLALGQIDEGLARALAATDKDIKWFENERALVLVRSKARISLPTDNAFGSYARAIELLHGPPLPATEYVFWNQGYFDAHLEYAIESPTSAFALDFGVATGLRDRLKIDLRYLAADGRERAYDLHTGQGRVILDPRWHQAALTFLVSGFEHILLGPDHLLFLICLILPFRRIDRHLVGVVSAFALGHSVTLIAAAYGMAPAGPWFAPLVEALIAASILFMAIENMLRPRVQRRWAASALFGLVHGFGFSFMLQSQLQFAGSNLLVSLVAFNVGVEAGQLLVMLAVLPTIAWLRRMQPDTDQAIAIVVCVLSGHVAWHWLVERSEMLWKVSGITPDRLPTLAALLFLLVALVWALRWALLRIRLRVSTLARTRASH
ncbi:MAG TPA: HupE/UreJ family protein [Rubrivivax sp.]|nr:HupE/UreJ family protein [Rubrivivax sp.]